MAECVAIAGLLLALASLAVPRIPRTHDREAALRKDLTVCRAAIQVFYDDTKHFPSTLADLSAPTAPDTGLNKQGEEEDISGWHGPYLSSVPLDPISNRPLTYCTTTAHLGHVSSSSSAHPSTGDAYASW